MADMNRLKVKPRMFFPTDASTAVASDEKQVYLNSKESGESAICRYYYRKERNNVES